MNIETQVPREAPQPKCVPIPGALRVVVLLSLGLLSNGCSESQPGKILQQTSGSEVMGELSLPIVGYNYTNREIGIFSVDGVGGGNIAMSGPRGGGGGIACCVRYQPGVEPSHHVIRWDVKTCKYHEAPPSTRGDIFQLHYFYSEKKVEVRSQSSVRPNYFEVHFFPDGSVKVQVTAELSAPLMALSAEREESPSPQCPGNVRPAVSF